MADAGHGGEEALQARWISVEHIEHAGATSLGLVLRLAGSKRLSEVAPETVQATACHLENTADVRGFVPVEKQIRFWCVGVAIPGSLQKAERHESIQEISRRARMQAKAFAEGCERLRTARELGEKPHLDRAQQRFRRPERQPRLKNPLGIRLPVHCSPANVSNLPIYQSSNSYLRFPIAQSAPVVRMKICPSETAGELSV